MAGESRSPPQLLVLAIIVVADKVCGGGPQARGDLRLFEAALNDWRKLSVPEGLDPSLIGVLHLLLDRVASLVLHAVVLFHQGGVDEVVASRGAGDAVRLSPHLV